MGKKKYNPNKAHRRPLTFGTPAECIKWLKKSVYLIARGRVIDPQKPNEQNWSTIGTGFVVAPNRMITAAHVIDDSTSKNDLAHHKAGDQYYVIKHDDEDVWHYRFFTLELNKTLFLFPDIDLGIIYLEDEFYGENGKVFAEKDDFIRVDQKFRPIGTEIGVLGYPLCGLDFESGDINKPLIGNILLRADTGIINCRYRTAKDVCLYEFTVAFNPGNSGGPIFDYRSGQLLSIVKGFKAIPIKIKEQVLSDDRKKELDLKNFTQNSYLDVVHANYSVGYATPSFTEIFRKHNII